MCVLYLSFESKVIMPWVVLCCLLSRLLVYSVGSGENRVQVLSRQKLYVCMVVFFWLHSYLCVWM